MPTPPNTPPRKTPSQDETPPIQTTPEQQKTPGHRTPQKRKRNLRVFVPVSPLSDEDDYVPVTPRPSSPTSTTTTQNVPLTGCSQPFSTPTNMSQSTWKQAKTARIFELLSSGVTDQIAQEIAELEFSQSSLSSTEQRKLFLLSDPRANSRANDIVLLETLVQRTPAQDKELEKTYIDVIKKRPESFRDQLLFNQLFNQTVYVGGNCKTAAFFQHTDNQSESTYLAYLIEQQDKQTFAALDEIIKKRILPCYLELQTNRIAGGNAAMREEYLRLSQADLFKNRYFFNKAPALRLGMLKYFIDSKKEFNAQEIKALIELIIQKMRDHGFRLDKDEHVMNIAGTDPFWLSKPTEMSQAAVAVSVPATASTPVERDENNSAPKALCFDC